MVRLISGVKLRPAQVPGMFEYPHAAVGLVAIGQVLAPDFPLVHNASRVI
jgi:hypothetical protein